MQATLTKWGNSQGIRIPREVCDLLGVHVGAKAEIDLDTVRSNITIRFEQPKRKYQRTKKITMEDLASGWTGEKVGEEWGDLPIGREAVE